MNERHEPSIPAPPSVQEKLQDSLNTYQNRMHELFLKMVEIKAAILEEEAWLDPNFNTTIMTAQADYHSIFRKILSETANSVKSVQNLAGAAGVVVKFIETSLGSIAQAAEVQRRVSTTLETQEEQTPLNKKKNLQARFDQITEYEKGMDDLITVFILHIAHLDTEVTEDVIEQASDLYREYQKLSRNIKCKIKESLQKIEEYLELNTLGVEKNLLRDVMSIYLARGDSGASVAGFNKPFVKLGHYFRKKWTRSAYLGSKLFEVSSLHKPGKFELQCLTAMLKRHPIADFSASHPDYQPFITKLKTILYLMGNSDLQLCQKLHLYSALALNKADKDALNANLLVRRSPAHQGLFSKSTYAKNKHLAVKDTLESHLTFARNKLNQEEHINKLQQISMSIIRFYVDHLVQQFLTHPFFQDWVKTHENADGEKELLGFLVEIINSELNDKTPANYYRSFLCGLSLFCGAIGNRGTIKLELDNNSKLTLNFSGCLTLSGETVQQDIELSHWLTKENVILV